MLTLLKVLATLLKRLSFVFPLLALVYLVYRLAIPKAGVMDLEGKVALITGSSRGLGLVLAEELARRGAAVVLCARQESELERARTKIERISSLVMAIPCDVSDKDQVERLVATVRDHFGRIDILINNAGIITMGPLQAQTIEDFQRSMDIMFWGMVYTTMAIYPEMVERKSGCIVNITSIGAQISSPHLLPYSSAKFAALGFSQGLRAELDKEGVKVVTVVPGFMRTGSYLNAGFKGRHRVEFTLFSLMANLPLVSTDARRAARQIINAIRRGDAQLAITPQANIIARLHGLIPGTFTDILALVNKLLPNAEGEGVSFQPVPGKESRTRISDSRLTALGERAAREFNQYPEESP